MPHRVESVLHPFSPKTDAVKNTSPFGSFLTVCQFTFTFSNPSTLFLRLASGKFGPPDARPISAVVKRSWDSPPTHFIPTMGRYLCRPSRMLPNPLPDH